MLLRDWLSLIIQVFHSVVHLYVYYMLLFTAPLYSKARCLWRTQNRDVQVSSEYSYAVIFHLLLMYALLTIPSLNYIILSFSPSLRVPQKCRSWDWSVRRKTPRLVYFSLFQFVYCVERMPCFSGLHTCWCHFFQRIIYLSLWWHTKANNISVQPDDTLWLNALLSWQCSMPTSNKLWRTVFFSALCIQERQVS